MTDAVAERLTGAEDVIWDLSIFYDNADDPRIDSDLDKIEQLADAFAEKYKGRVADLDAEEMVDSFKEREVMRDLTRRAGAFASLQFATDTNNPVFGALQQKINERLSDIGQKLVFFDLEWNAVDDAQADQLLSDPTLGKYAYHLEAERRNKPYMLSEIEEQLLIDKSVTGRSAWVRLFTQLMGSLRLDYDGEQLTLTQVLTKLRDADRDVRRKAADAITAILRERSMELGYIFNVLTADKASDDRRRGYETWVSSRNLSNKAPDAVVDALIETVTANYDLVARHYDLKRRLMGYDELTDYDRYAPLPVKDSEAFYTWDEAKDIVLNAFYSFSPRMGEVAQKFFDENWIHAPVMPGKRGGAFASNTTPSAHPFVFVNFQGKAGDVMTLAHELGHGVHMYLASEAQGLYGMFTPLTTAEMASVFNEMVVFQDLMAREADREVQLSMLVEKVEDTFATVFRQTSMNRFEDGLHTARRSEGELSTDRLSEIWLETQRAMFGDSVNLRDDYGLWWSYVPHFLHTPGYVYAYAFGELLVLALYNIYREQGDSFAPKYIDLLAAGDSDWPDKLLATVGVDLNDPGFWGKGVDAIRDLIEQEETLARELYPERFA